MKKYHKIFHLFSVLMLLIICKKEVNAQFGLDIGIRAVDTISGSKIQLSPAPVFGIPMKYDGAFIGTLNFTIGSAGSCTADLAQQPTQKITNVWSLNNCSAIVPGTLTK